MLSNSVKISAVVWLLLLCVLDAAAQRRMEGYVRDSTGQALEFANVMVLSAANKHTIAFCHTDEKGFYALQVPSDSNNLLLKATLLGYRAVEIPLNSSALAIKKDIVLLLSSTALKEVVVRERATPVRQRSDTTAWRVASFADSTEVSVEDLLRKLPGVEVSEQGAIKINGKAIDKILIEGDDLFGRDYSLASRNIRANSLETVEAIDRYQDNAVLSGIKGSDAIVLNLKLKDEVKRVLSGNFTAGSGWGGAYKYYLHGNLFSFAKRGKTFVFGDLNNAGFDAMSDAEFFMSGSGLESASEYRTPELPNASVLNLPTPRELGLPRAITRPDQTGLVMFNHLTTLKPSWRLKVQGIAARSRVQQQYYNVSRFRLPDVPAFDVQEAHSFRQKTMPGSVQIETEYLPGHLRTRLKCFSQYRAARNTTESFLLRRQNADTAAVPQQWTDQPATWLNTVEYTRKIREHSAFQAEAQYIWLDRPQEMYVNWDRYALFFSTDPGTILKQTVASRRQQAKALARWITVGKAGEWNIESGYVWQAQTLRSQAGFQVAESLRPVIPDGYANDHTFRRPAFFIAAKWQHHFGAWHTTMSTDMRHVSVRDNLQKTQNAAEFVLFSPQLRLMRPMRRFGKLTLQYHYMPELPNAEGLYTDFIWTDYRSAQRGIADYEPTGNHFSRIAYAHRNTEKLTFFNAHITMTNTRNGFGTDFTVDSFFSAAMGFRPIAGNQYAANAQADKYFSALSSRMSIALQYIGFQQNNKLNNALLRHNFFQMRSIRIGYGSAFDGWVNVFINSTLLHNTARVRLEGAEQNTAATSWRTTWRTVVKPSKKWRVEATVHHLDNYLGTDRSSRLFVWDGLFQIFTAKNARRSLELSFHNILNKKIYEQVGITDFLENRDGLRLVPRFFMLKYEYTI